MTLPACISTWIAVVVATGAVVVIVAVVACHWTQVGASQISAAGWAAMVFGALVTSALGIGLMALVFYSDRSNADEGAYRTAGGADDSNSTGRRSNDSDHQ